MTGDRRLKGAGQRVWHLLVLALPALMLLSGGCAGRSPRAGNIAPATAQVNAPVTAVPLVVPLNEEPGAPRSQTPLTILQINDVYSTVPIDGIGGLARVASVKKQLTASGRAPLLIIAGDFLSPSVASSLFRGEQMVAALNSAGLDLATLGNHEFDFGVDLLRQRMKESRFEWIVSNVVEADGRPFAGAAPYLVKTFGRLRVGFIGIVLASEQLSADRLGGLRLLDPFESAARYLAILKQERVDVIVAVTHLSIEDDRRLVERFPEIDVVVGGHEHYPIVLMENRTLISKAGTDARFIARIDVDKHASVERFFELMPVTAAIPEDPATAAVVDSYERRLGTDLDRPVVTVKVPLDAEEVRLRAGETNLGNLFADALRASAGAEIAIMNAGSIRGDRVYPRGPLTRRTIIAMHPFGNRVTKVEVTGGVLLDALNWGTSKLPATAGHFPQVSGLTMTVDLRAPALERIRSVRIGGEPLDANRRYVLALPDYILNGGDGYSMFPSSATILTGPESGELLVSAFERHLQDQSDLPATASKRITVLR